ncbi:helix-turn-helix domain-containing protein [Sphingomonas alpina]|uniref:Helix-turn-helix domain-containing protein n=1 Tax=Sphingomonas alpina TaxID=653931 RepID=A0A7H0LEW3_9SPHN|nr:helix-turn-helix domain-containing protein [Sphingomonas alpina]QNQ08216.1 helix-turn-helix domain-containing protein [Sphingomonas alpina]
MPDTPHFDPPHSVAILAYQGLCLFEYATALEVLSNRRSADDRPLYAVASFSLEGSSILTDRGVPITVEASDEVFHDAQTIVVPGWRMGPVPDPIAAALAMAHRRGARIVSICTGAFVLAAAGLLDERHATTHWQYADQLARDHPRVSVDAMALYIDEGSIITSAGSSAGIDMLLHLMRRDFGAAACNAAARAMVVPPHREGGQAQYAETPVAEVHHKAFSMVIERLRRDPAGDHRIETLAATAAMSPRTFFRKFRAATGHTPYDWILLERIRLAKAMLAEGDLPVERIAERAGFGAADTFRHHFRRVVGTTPSQFRAAFQHDGNSLQAAE